MNELRDRLEHLAAAPVRSTALDVFERARSKAAVMRRRRSQRRFLCLGAAGVFVAVAVTFAIQAQPDRHALTIQATRSSSTTSSTSGTASATGCTHSPIVRSDDYYHGLPAPNGSSIDFRQSHLAGGDDGHGYTISQVGLTVEKTGPDGTITLTHGASTDEGVGLRGFGDFDGDGRSDLLVDMSNYDTYIVPGTLGPGKYDAAVVGVRVQHPHYEPDAAYQSFPEAIGDQNHDGADDVSFGARLYSGRQVMAVPAGGTLPTPIRTLTADYVGLLRIDSASTPSFVIPDESIVSLEVLDDRSDRLLFDVGSNDLQPALQYGPQVTGWLVNGHHIVQLSYSTRTFGTTWRWDLDTPCGT